MLQKVIQERHEKKKQFRAMSKMCEELERRVHCVNPLQKKPFPAEVKARDKFLQKVRDHPRREESAKRKAAEEGEHFEVSKKQKASRLEDIATPVHLSSLMSSVHTPLVPYPESDHESEANDEHSDGEPSGSTAYDPHADAVAASATDHTQEVPSEPFVIAELNMITHDVVSDNDIDICTHNSVLYYRSMRELGIEYQSRNNSHPLHLVKRRVLTQRAEHMSDLRRYYDRCEILQDETPIEKFATAHDDDYNVYLMLHEEWLEARVRELPFDHLFVHPPSRNYTFPPPPNPEDRVFTHIFPEYFNVIAESQNDDGSQFVSDYWLHQARERTELSMETSEY